MTIQIRRYHMFGENSILLIMNRFWKPYVFVVVNSLSDISCCAFASNLHWTYAVHNINVTIDKIFNFDPHVHITMTYSTKITQLIALITQITIEFIHNSHLVNEFNKIKFTKIQRPNQGLDPDNLLGLSSTLTIILDCFLCLCEALIESYSCMGDYLHFEKNRIFLNLNFLN